MTANLLTTKQAAALLHITPNLLRQWVHRKKITAMYPGLFDPDEIERITFQRNNKNNTPSLAVNKEQMKWSLYQTHLPTHQ